MTIPAEMRAARLDVAAHRLTVETVPVRLPGASEVLVQVKACGICLSDVHIIDGSLPVRLPQLTLGHEAAGLVAALGPHVPGWAVGDKVVMAGGRSCGRCRNCMRGHPNERCLAYEIMGAHFDGAWAEYVVVPYQSLSLVPEHIPFEQAAILADAVSTPYAGLVDRAALRAGESVGLWGIGGLGVHAVQVARMVGAAPIIAIDPLPAARERALSFGADAAFHPTEDDVPAEVARLTGGLMLDLTVDLFGSNAALAQASRCTARFGRTLMVGLSHEAIHLGPGAIFGLRSQSLLGHLGYRKEHLDQLVALVASGRLDVSKSISDVMSLEDVAHGVEQLTSKRGNPIRLLVAP